jgi:hypothetical protein
LAGTLAAAAQTPNEAVASGDDGAGRTAAQDRNAGGQPHIDCSNPGVICDPADNPVAEVRQQRSWEFGPFVNWGTGVGDRSDYKFFWAGYELSKVLTPVVHAGFLSGQFQYGGNIIPLWRWDVSWRKHRAGDFPLEFSDQVAEVSAMVPSRRRTDLHDAQISAQLYERCSAGYRWGNERMEFLAAGRGGSSLFLAQQEID